MASAADLNPNEVKEIADRLWDDEQVYQVSGIISSWEEIFYYAPMPLMLEATFMPFKNVIISDGLVVPYKIVIGGNMAKNFKDIYITAKKNKTLHKSL